MNNRTCASTPGSVMENVDDIPSEKNVETLQASVSICIIMFFFLSLLRLAMCMQYYKLETIVVVSDVITYCEDLCRMSLNFPKAKRG